MKLLKAHLGCGSHAAAATVIIERSSSMLRHRRITVKYGSSGEDIVYDGAIGCRSVHDYRECPVSMMDDGDDFVHRHSTLHPKPPLYSYRFVAVASPLTGQWQEQKEKKGCNGEKGGVSGC